MAYEIGGRDLKRSMLRGNAVGEELMDNEKDQGDDRGDAGDGVEEAEEERDGIGLAEAHQEKWRGLKGLSGSGERPLSRWWCLWETCAFSSVAVSLECLYRPW